MQVHSAMWSLPWYYLIPLFLALQFNSWLVSYIQLYNKLDDKQKGSNYCGLAPLLVDLFCLTCQCSASNSCCEVSLLSAYLFSFFHVTFNHFSGNYFISSNWLGFQTGPTSDCIWGENLINAHIESLHITESVIPPF